MEGRIYLFIYGLFKNTYIYKLYCVRLMSTVVVIFVFSILVRDTNAVRNQILTALYPS